MDNPTIPPDGLRLGATYTTRMKIAMGRGVPVPDGVALPVQGLDALTSALMFPSRLSKYS